MIHAIGYAIIGSGIFGIGYSMGRLHELDRSLSWALRVFGNGDK